MSSTANSKSNSLSTLLGEYMSDSDNDEEQQAKKKYPKKSTTSSKQSAEGLNHQSTYWTECIDPTTGHPYYWNTETKEVTWEKPSEYTNYLNYMKSLYTTLPQDSWVVGYSDDTQTPYYVNEITRVVSWEKPANFKEKSIVKSEEIAEKSAVATQEAPVSKSEGKTETDKAKRKHKVKKSIKKSLPKHLLPTESDDEKIELISEYAEPEASTDEEEMPKDKLQTTKMKSSKNPLNLVAAYASGSDSDDGESKTARKRAKTNTVDTKSAESQTDQNSNRNSPSLNLDTNSFASIITGGKPLETCMDEELNKFKEEIENDLRSLEASEAAAEKEAANSSQEPNFDEKTFQRKRRIEFRTKGPSSKSDIATDSGSAADVETTENDGCSAVTKPKFINFQKSHVEFENSKSSPEPIVDVVYGPKPLSPDDCPEVEAAGSEVDTKVQCDDNHRIEIDDLCDVIGGKVKFLSTGKAEVSAVQIMSIQLEALQSAFRASCLDSDYFFKWLKTTSDDLSALEQNAAPEGWDCKWDRENSQYCYKNLKTNETQWEFPCEKVQEEPDDVADDLKKLRETESNVRDDDEMDISMTPPPPPSPPIISGEGAYRWDANNSTAQINCTVPVQQADISGELASFYSDIASLDTTTSTAPQVDIVESVDNSKSDQVKVTIIDEAAAKKAKKRKKIKVPGLASKMQEVSMMVANWQKAQKELGN